jgi:uncharacterized protein (DUF697 family)
MMKALIHPLDVHRGLILSRSLVAGAAGMVPVPYLDDLLANLVRESLIRRLAELRNVDADAAAVQAVSTPRGSRLLTAATLGSAALGGTRRIFRRVAASLLVVRRVDEAMQTFQVGTLFDHYCARHHVGMGLDAQRAAQLRTVMERAMRETQGETLQRAFRSTLRMPGALTLALPRLLLSRFKRRGPVDAEKIDADLRKAESSSWAQRATAAVGGIGKGYARALADSFDQAWEARS